MKKTLFFILSFVLMSNCVYAMNFKPGSEPDGFRNIKWEQEISTFSDMEHVETRQDCMKAGCGSIEIYLRKDDVMKIGNANLDSIEYRFCGSKFYEASIELHGKENYEAIKSYLFATYGFDRTDYFSSNTWTGNKASVHLYGGREKAKLNIWANALYLDCPRPNPAPGAEPQKFGW